MKAIVRGFLAGFGFALGASVAGTLIGYAIGRIGEAGLKQLLSSRSEQPSPQHGGTGSSADDLDLAHRERLIEEGWRLGYAAHKDEANTDAQNRPDNRHYGVADQPKTNLCECLKFKIWYRENGIDVCQCGHPRVEHLDSERSCTGEVEIIPAQHKSDSDARYIDCSSCGLAHSPTDSTDREYEDAPVCGWTESGYICIKTKGHDGEHTVLSPEQVRDAGHICTPTQDDKCLLCGRMIDGPNDRILHCSNLSCPYITMDPDLLRRHESDAHGDSE